MEGHVAKGDKILIVCSGEDKLDESKSIVEKLSNLVGDGGEVFVEKISQVIQSKQKTSSFSKCFYGYIDKKPSIKPLGGNVLEDLVRIVIPNGRLFVKKSTEEDCSTASFIAQLKFAGFVDVKESRDEIVCNKPDYEVGSKVSIETGKVEGSTKIWQLAADNLLDDDELIDDDSLLTEDDLKKPDPESLRVCGTTGKRKACANCSCGLADELANEEKGKIQSNVHNAKSSCGSCYLGDAFRCASCPYLGMPAFKPGEKVTIDPTSDL